MSSSLRDAGNKGGKDPWLSGISQGGKLVSGDLGAQRKHDPEDSAKCHREVTWRQTGRILPGRAAEHHLVPGLGWSALEMGCR